MQCSIANGDHKPVLETPRYANGRRAVVACLPDRTEHTLPPHASCRDCLEPGLETNLGGRYGSRTDPLLSESATVQLLLILCCPT